MSVLSLITVSLRGLCEFPENTVWSMMPRQLWILSVSNTATQSAIHLKLEDESGSVFRGFADLSMLPVPESIAVITFYGTYFAFWINQCALLFPFSMYIVSTSRLIQEFAFVALLRPYTISMCWSGMAILKLSLSLCSDIMIYPSNTATVQMIFGVDIVLHCPKSLTLSMNSTANF